MSVSTDEFFGFSHRPFRGTPDPQDYVPITSVEQEIQQLTEAASQGDGIAVLTAPPGAGKTVVCERLRHELSDCFVTAVLSSSGFATRRSLLQAILFVLGRSYESFAEQELRLGILNYARSIGADAGDSESFGSCKHGIVLIIDEAHLLNVRLLEELRCLTNHSEGGRTLIRVILCGQLPLEESLVDPALQALNYRITCHATLEPLSMQESAELIAGRLVHAGRTVDAVFTPDALETICRVSDGHPRCLVQLCDHTLALAAARAESPATVETVRRALQDLKQLPLQWNESAVDRVADATEVDTEMLLDDERRIAEDDDTIATTSIEGEITDEGVWSQEDVSNWTGDVASVEVGSASDEDVETDDTATSGWASFEPGPLDESRTEPATITRPEAIEPDAAPVEAARETTDSIIEQPIEDVYATLDNATGRSHRIPASTDLIRSLDTLVSSLSTLNPGPAIPQHPASVEGRDAESAIEAALQSDVGVEQRVDDIISALDIVTERRRHDDEWVSTSEQSEVGAFDVEDPMPWQTDIDGTVFESLEPQETGDPEWEEETVVEPIPVRDAGLLEDVAEIPSPSQVRKPAQTPRERVADSSKTPRPYARLFSRLRQRA